MNTACPQWLEEHGEVRQVVLALSAVGAWRCHLQVLEGGDAHGRIVSLPWQKRIVICGDVASGDGESLR
ncbi:hypothetical protein Y1Q_0024328 [Alligator mississippiensis]|uniref:Uncharacterized protein n=1 Tax=Alligator mississippiensis TaxID=8496 RepID=A0A151NIN2_ALLMI|nr:hypothetical protein Y1Q_0024328 [Alligator mississippiensis]